MQDTMTHWPAWHWLMAWGRAQAWPQVPQLSASVSRSISQPSVLSPLQSAVVAGTQLVTTHCPCSQVQLLPCRATQLVAHVPQWVGSESSFASHPVMDCPSQSAKPGWHWSITQPPFGPHLAAALASAQGSQELLAQPVSGLFVGMQTGSPFAPGQTFAP